MSRSLAGFRTRGPFSGFGTEVSYLVPLLTSVPEARFQGLGRKFPAWFPCRLPYQSPVFCILYGSFMPGSLADFRTGGAFSGFGTEVSCLVYLPTSVPKARFQGFGRKFHGLRAF